MNNGDALTRRQLVDEAYEMGPSKYRALFAQLGSNVREHNSHAGGNSCANTFLLPLK